MFIPDELKKDKCWVNVGKGSKIPMMTTSYTQAKSNDPSTWGTYDEAYNNICLGRYANLGYVFHDNGIVGIDLDHCFNENDELMGVASDILPKAGLTYVEKSVSGKGVHILVKGDLPFDGKNSGQGVEIYKTKRFFILTGDRIGGKQIEENQALIDFILEKYFDVKFSKATNSKNREYAGVSNRMYSYTYRRPDGNTLFLEPQYPPIKQGTRNQSLASLAGSLLIKGYDIVSLERELLKVNAICCNPPLPEREVKMIVRSITRYQ